MVADRLGKPVYNASFGSVVFSFLGCQVQVLVKQVVVLHLQFGVLLLGCLVLVALEHFKVYCLRARVILLAVLSSFNQVFVVGLHDGRVLVLLVMTTLQRLLHLHYLATALLHGV